MHFFVIFLLSAAVIVQGNLQYHQRYYSDGLQQYPNYYPDTNVQSPNLIHDGRLFWSLFTSTTTTTTTTTTTCTISTTACTTGRRKRFLEHDEEEIVPSQVNKVETTEVIEMDSDRKVRKAEPQLPYYWRDYPDYGMPQSTFGHHYYPTANYNPYYPKEVIVADPRLFLRVTTTSTSTITTTFRSTPICSQGSGYNAC